VSPSRSRSKARLMPTVPASAIATHKTPAETSADGRSPPRNEKAKINITIAANRSVA
jgi:hypothetical protein